MREKEVGENGEERKMGKVKYVAKSFYCETCNKPEEITAKEVER